MPYRIILHLFCCAVRALPHHMRQIAYHISTRYSFETLCHTIAWAVKRRSVASASCWTHFHAQWWQMGGRVFIRNHDCWAMIGWNHVRIHHPTLLLLMRLATCLSNENQKQNCQHIQQRVPFIYLDGDLYRLHISLFHWSEIIAVVR